jgi:hypothetical protein
MKVMGYTTAEITAIERELMKGTTTGDVAKKFAVAWNRSPGAVAQKAWMIKGKGISSGSTKKESPAETLTDEYIKKLICASIYPEGGMESVNSITPEDIQTYREGLVVKRVNSSLIKNGGNISKEELAKAKKKIYMQNYNAVKSKEKQESSIVDLSDLAQLTTILTKITNRKTEIQYHLDALNQLLNNL